MTSDALHFFGNGFALLNGRFVDHALAKRERSAANFICGSCGSHALSLE
jgi:hypothetical protein